MRKPCWALWNATAPADRLPAPLAEQRALLAEFLVVCPALGLEEALLAEATITPAPAARPSPPAGAVAMNAGGQAGGQVGGQAGALVLHYGAAPKLDPAMLLALEEALTYSRLEGGRAQLNLSATGPDFCLGLHATAPVSLLRGWAQAAPQAQVLVQGGCADGGLGLCLAATVLARPEARFFATTPLPGLGAATALARRLGPARARQILLDGAVLDAPTALAWGLADQILRQSA